MKITSNNNDKDNDRDILPINSLFNKLFNLDVLQRESALVDTKDLFRDIDEIHKEINRMFNVFNDDSLTNAPKELIREYETSKGGKVKEVGPIVYGYSMTMGPNGRPHVREFGNITPVANIEDNFGKSSLLSETESLYDINTTDKEIKIVLEMPGLQEEDIKINTYGRKVEIKTSDLSTRKYYKVVDLPEETDTKTTRFTYNNGILEVTFDKKKDVKTKGKYVYARLRNMFSNILYRILESKSKILKYTR